MEDLLSMQMDQIPDPSSTEVKAEIRERKERIHVDPFNHFEVCCDKVSCVYVGDSAGADKAYSESQSQAKALIHVQGRNRLVVETNAPYLWLTRKLEESDVKKSDAETL